MICVVAWTVLTGVLWLMGAVAILAGIQARSEDAAALLPPLATSLRGTTFDRCIRRWLDWRPVLFPAARILFASASFFLGATYQVLEFACGIVGAVAKITGEWASLRTEETRGTERTCPLEAKGQREGTRMHETQQRCDLKGRTRYVPLSIVPPRAAYTISPCPVRVYLLCQPYAFPHHRRRV